MIQRIFIGIDTGCASGAIALIIVNMDGSRQYDSIRFKDMPLFEIYDKLKAYRDSADAGMVAILEKVWALPGMNVVAMSGFLKNVGHSEMMLIALGIPFEEVVPTTWMKHYNMKKTKGETKTVWKKRLREVLSRLIPEFKSCTETADAMLIAKYCLDKNL